MEQTDLVLKIQGAYNQFTRAERKVADYCLAHAQDVCFSSISDLAEACGVGDASVSRFCRTLELSGYQEFKMLLSLSQNSTQRDEKAQQSVPNRVLALHLEAMEQTQKLLDEQTLQRAQESLQRAGRIYFFGIGDSLLVAKEARNQFLRITDKVICIADTHMMAVTSTMLGPEDLVVMISYSGATRDVIRIAELAKKSGAEVMALTHYRKSPLTAIADQVLLCGGQEGPLDRGSLAAKAGQTYLIDVLCQGYYEQNEAESRANKEKAAAAVVDKTY